MKGKIARKIRGNWLRARKTNPDHFWAFYKALPSTIRLAIVRVGHVREFRLGVWRPSRPVTKIDQARNAIGALVAKAFGKKEAVDVG